MTRHSSLAYAVRCLYGLGSEDQLTAVQEHTRSVESTPDLAMAIPIR